MTPWAGYSAPDGVPWLRCCRVDITSGQRRFEVPGDYGAAGPSCLTLSCDECSANMAPFCYLTSQLGVRCILVRDHAHRQWNDLRNSLAEAEFGARCSP